MAKKIIKQLVDGVEKLLVVDVVEEIDIEEVRNRYNGLMLEKSKIEDVIAFSNTNIERVSDEIKKYENEIAELNRKIVEANEALGSSRETIEISKVELAEIQKQIDELSQFVELINQVENPYEPIKEQKEQPVKLQEEISTTQFNRPIGVMRRFGRTR